MQYYKIDPQNPDPKIIKKAVECLKKGGVIVYPTDTLYGLGIDTYNRNAVNKLFLIKQRDMRRPVSLLVDSIERIEEEFGLDEEVKSDLEKLLPGRITAVIKNKKQKKNPILEQIEKEGEYLPTVGVRIPDHPVSAAIAAEFKSPISSTSANISGMDNVFSIQNVIAQFSSELDFILDAGPIQESMGSTIIDFTSSPYLILRDGDFPKDELKEILGKDRIYQQRKEYVITFVCSGNICRSPIAEAVLKKMLSKTKYKDFIRVHSAGTLRMDSSPAHDFAVDISRENEVDLNDHLSKHINREIVKESSIIFCLAQNHYNYLVERYPTHRDKIFLLKQWKSNHQVSIPSIADPIGHSYEFFKDTFSEIRAELKRILPSILVDVKKFAEFHKL
ncbi:MAG: threonylcarbamoyl-AMP synthase [Calditrichaeota bacterium]|nr:threonylcarbamoyl-AMP synthase [Calditrichota bacterium]